MALARSWSSGLWLAQAECMAAAARCTPCCGAATWPLHLQRPGSRAAAPGRRAASVAKTAKSVKQRGNARLPVASGDEVADLLDAGELVLQAPACQQLWRMAQPTNRNVCAKHLYKHAALCCRRRSPADAQRRQPRARAVRHGRLHARHGRPHGHQCVCPVGCAFLRNSSAVRIGPSGARSCHSADVTAPFARATFVQLKWVNMLCRMTISRRRTFRWARAQGSAGARSPQRTSTMMTTATAGRSAVASEANFTSP